MTAWSRVCALLGMGSLAVWLLGGPALLADAGTHAWAWQAGNWLARPWTLWTGAWVHGSAGQLAAYLLALCGIAILGRAVGAGREAAIALAVAWPLSTLSLLLWPQVARYAGLGAPVHAALMILWAHVALRGVARPLSYVLFTLVGIKVMAEHAWVAPVAFDPEWGTNVVVAAHLGGALVGAACGLVAAALMPHGTVTRP